ncbi:MAG TPA: serine/threonine-protein kinase [Myxococcota bacterium]|nr:serine/threonine-protein kinase [Myxococcota bacterium]
MAETLERYRIIEEVGQGGMSVVYRAQDTALDREVAVKILHQHLAGQPEARARFHREARAVAKLRHPNILEIYDYSGEHSEKSFIVTEFIRGRTLRAFAGNTALPLPELAAMVCIKICEALAHAHAQGILHRDLKPENIMVRDDGTLKLMDFGIAQMVDAQSVTMTGTLLGSPAHMSPEHIEGKPLDFRADVFALGTILYFLATGALPFQGDNPHAVFRQIMDGRFREPAALNPAIGDELARIIKRAMAREPAARYATAGALKEALAAFAARSGLADVDNELAAYLRAPEPTAAALRGRVVAALLAAGRRSLAADRVGEGVDAFNRVLALDEGNRDVRAELARLARARRLRSASKWAAAAFVAASITGYGVYRWVTLPPGPRAVPFEFTSTGSIDAVLGTSTSLTGTAVTGEPDDEGTPAPRTAAVTLVATTVTATARPMSASAVPPATAAEVHGEAVVIGIRTNPAPAMKEEVTVFVDGKEMRRFPPPTVLPSVVGFRGEIRLERGRTYVIAFASKHMHYEVGEYMVPIEGDAPPINVLMQWKNATLEVKIPGCDTARLEKFGTKPCNKPIEIPMLDLVDSVRGSALIGPSKTPVEFEITVEAGVDALVWEGGR